MENGRIVDEHIVDDHIVDDYVRELNFNFEAIACLINDFMLDFESKALEGHGCGKTSCSIRLLMLQRLITKMSEDWNKLYEASGWDEC